MKRRTRVTLLGLAAFAVTATGCNMKKGMIDVGAIESSISTVTERHDDYVEADTSLSDVEKSTALRSSELLRRIVDEAKK